MPADIILRVDHEIDQAKAAGDTPVMLHLGGKAYDDLKFAIKQLPTDERVATGSLSMDQSVAVQFRHLPCRRYEELPSTWVVVIRDSTHTRTLLGLPEKRVLVPEDSVGQAWLDANKRKRRR